MKHTVHGASACQDIASHNRTHHWDMAAERAVIMPPERVPTCHQCNTVYITHEPAHCLGTCLGTKRRWNDTRVAILNQDIVHMACVNECSCASVWACSVCTSPVHDAGNTLFDTLEKAMRHSNEMHSQKDTDVRTCAADTGASMHLLRLCSTAVL